MQRKLISNTIKKETSKVSVCFDSDRLAAAAGDKQVRDDPAATAQLKEEQLRELFRRLGSVVVAYSGGVDSSYVAYVANAELGERALCITGESASLAQYQRTEIDRV